MPYQPAYRTERKPIIDPKLTTHREAWPKAESGKSFIFEAIEIVGKAKFGSEWTDKELQALNWPVQPREAHEKSVRLAPVNSGGGAPGSSRRSYTHPPSIARLARTPSVVVAQILSKPDAHVLAFRRENLVRAEQVAWEENQKARDRLLDAFEWLAQLCRDGEIVAYARPEVGGALYPMSSFEWNVEGALQHFVSKGSFKRFFPEFKQAWSAYVFFNRDDLARITGTLSGASSLFTEVDLASVSPYLRFAVRLAAAKGYTKRGAVTVDARRADIEETWNEAFPDVPLSGKLKEALTTLTGWPDPDAIKRGQLGGNKKRA